MATSKLTNFTEPLVCTPFKQLMCIMLLYKEQNIGKVLTPKSLQSEFVASCFRPSSNSQMFLSTNLI